MKSLKFRMIAALLAAALLAGGVIYTVASSTAGSSADPFVSLSHLNGSFTNTVTSSTNSLLDSMQTRITSQLSSAQSGVTATDWLFGDGYSKLFLKEGDALETQLGTSFVVLAGQAVVSVNSGELLDLTDGTSVAHGSTLKTGHRYFTAEDSTVYYIISSDSAVVTVDGSYKPGLSSNADYYAMANALNAMNLFRGSDNGYDLERAATRIEGLIMLIRLMGEEEAALACTDSHPFTDVMKWADPYVAYAYKMGYTKGVSETRFGYTSTVTANQYMTFVLRALGYTEENSGYSWDSAVLYAYEQGMISAAEAEKFLNDEFLRAQVVYISYHALPLDLYDGSAILLQKLIESGVCTSDAAGRALSSVAYPNIM